MNEQLFDFFIYTVAACHVISLVYLFYANYVRVRHTQLGKTAATAASVVAVPWLIYAVFFVARQIACGDTGAPFYASLSCVHGRHGSAGRCSGHCTGSQSPR
jgi:hypothetical protein